MARQRKIEIEASKLACFDSLVAELQQHPAFEGFDAKTLKVTALETYTPVIVDVDKAIKSLDRYEYMNRDKIQIMLGVQILTKVKVAKALGISRPTLDRWIADGFLDGCPVSLHRTLECYQLPLIRQKLVEYRDRSDK